MKKFNVLGYELNIPDELEVFNLYRNIFKKEAQKNAIEFRKEYREEVKKYDDLYIASAKGENLINKSVDKAIELLVLEGILTVDRQLFNKKYGEYIDFEVYYSIVRQQDKLNNISDMQNYELQLKQAQRARWQGGGFGVKGALKGAMTAGALNMGNDLLHSIGDSNRRKQNERNISLEEEDIFRNPKTLSALTQGVFNCTLNIFLGLMNELQENRKAQYVNIDSDGARAVFNNILKYKEKGSQEYIKGILECILKNPYEFEFYEELLGGDHHKNEVIDLAVYFGYYNEMHEIIDPMLQKEEEARKKEEQYKKSLIIYFTEEELNNSIGKFDLRREVEYLGEFSTFKQEPSIEDLKFKGYMLGKHYLEGALGYELNYERAVFWLNKSAKLEYPPSQTLLGYLLIEGKLIEQNIKNGLELLNKAVKNGDDEGKIKLAEIYIEGKYTEKNVDEGIKLLKSALESKGEDKYRAAYQLGELYKNGICIEKNSDRAKTYYEIAKKSKENTKILAEQRLKELNDGLAQSQISEEEIIEQYETKQQNKFRRNRIILYIVVTGAINFAINKFISWKLLKYGLMILFLANLIVLIKDEITGKINYNN